MQCSVVLSSTSALSTKLVTKQQFWEDTTCWQRFCFHNRVLFWKRKDRPTFKKQNIDKISHQKGLTVCEKHAVKRVQRHAWHSAHHWFPWPIPMIHCIGFWSDTSLHIFPDHCFVDNCRRRDEIWPDTSTKKSVFDDSNNVLCIWQRLVLIHKEVTRNYFTSIFERSWSYESQCIHYFISIIK